MDKGKTSANSRGLIRVLTALVFLALGALFALLALLLLGRFSVCSNAGYAGATMPAFAWQLTASRNAEICECANELQGKCLLFYSETKRLTELVNTLQEAVLLAEADRDAAVERLAGLQDVWEEIEEYRYLRRRLNYEIVAGNPGGFANFFEAVHYDTGERLFQQIRAQQQADRDFFRYAATYREMGSMEQAELFSVLLITNPDLLLRILGTFNSTELIGLFEQMAMDEVVAITRLMAPDAIHVEILPPVIVIEPEELIDLPVNEYVEDNEASIK